MIRNLIFYCYPIQGTVWPWHIERLVRHRDAWNGRRIAMVSLDQQTEKESVVRDRLAPAGVEVVVRKNHPTLHETAHFVEALSMLESPKEDEATFYCHAKGVTRKEPMLSRIRTWIEAMYVLNLTHPLAIDKLLEKYATVGCFRQNLVHAGAPWCFAGTFFWLKHSEIFKRNWRDINPEKYGVEGYPGRHMRFGESYGLTKDNISPGSLYEGSVTQALTEEWLSAVRRLTL